MTDPQDFSVGHYDSFTTICVRLQDVKSVEFNEDHTIVDLVTENHIRLCLEIGEDKSLIREFGIFLSKEGFCKRLNKEEDKG